MIRSRHCTSGRNSKIPQTYAAIFIEALNEFSLKIHTKKTKSMTINKNDEEYINAIIKINN